MVRKLRNAKPAFQEQLPLLEELAAELADELLLFVFGSYAQNRATPLSDLDLAYLPREELDREQALALDQALYRRLSRLLKSDDFTLVNLRQAPPTLAFTVLTEGRRLSPLGNGGWTAFRERIFALYPESRRLKQHALEAFAHQLRRGGFPMPVDRDKVLEQLRRLDADLRKLREKAQLPRDAYLADSDAQDVVERRLQTATECCLNIGNHLIATLGLPVAEDYASVFTSLASGGIIPPDVAEGMADMARFRNLLVHLYWRVNPAQVHQTLPQRIATLEAFSQAIVRFLGLDAEPPVALLLVAVGRDVISPYHC
ncbi:MAG: DUF86 domain-containing protein [Ardenticatenia bacterium]|nr:DUF86 domain-containing protein [Ardenticatenia bacterium]